MTALITGASSGIGREFAWELAGHGENLVLVARGRERLEALATQLRNVAGVQVEVLVADLATLEGARSVAARICAGEGASPITLLINNAGFGLGQDFIGGTLGRELEALDTMVRAVLITCHAAARVMKERGSGAILNVSSLTALTAQGTYSAHKAWVRTFTEGLAASLHGTGVHVSVLCPGLVHTEFHQRSHVDASRWPAWQFADPATVVQAGLEGLACGRVIITPTPLNRIAAFFARLAPRWAIRRFAGPSLSGRN